MNLVPNKDTPHRPARLQQAKLKLIAAEAEAEEANNQLPELLLDICSLEWGWDEIRPKLAQPSPVNQDFQKAAELHHRYLLQAYENWRRVTKIRNKIRMLKNLIEDLEVRASFLRREIREQVEWIAYLRQTSGGEPLEDTELAASFLDWLRQRLRELTGEEL